MLQLAQAQQLLLAQLAPEVESTEALDPVQSASISCGILGTDAWESDEITFTQKFKDHLTSLLAEGKTEEQKAQIQEKVQHFSTEFKNKSYADTSPSSNYTSSMWGKSASTPLKTLKVFGKMNGVKTEVCRLVKEKTNGKEIEYLQLNIRSLQYWFGRPEETAKAMVATFLTIGSVGVLRVTKNPKRQTQIDKHFEKLCKQHGLVVLYCTHEEKKQFDALSKEQEAIFIKNKIEEMYSKPRQVAEKEQAMKKLFTPQTLTRLDAENMRAKASTSPQLS